MGSGDGPVDGFGIGRTKRVNRSHETSFEAGHEHGMEKALWYLLVGTRGGENRVRIIRSLSDRPRNANQLADELDLDYNTVRHHLDTLVEHDVVDPGDSDYGTLYFLTDRFEHHREQFERIVEQMES